jgi:hypothetical protein
MCAASKNGAGYRPSCRRQRRINSEGFREREPGAQRSEAPGDCPNSQTPSGVTEALDRRLFNCALPEYPPSRRPFQGSCFSGMAYPEFRFCFTPGFTCAAPPVLRIDCAAIGILRLFRYNCRADRPRTLNRYGVLTLGLDYKKKSKSHQGRKKRLAKERRFTNRRGKLGGLESAPP